MGELLTTMATAGAVRSLNGLFNATNYPDTKKAIKALRDIHKPFLKPASGNDTPRRKRQRSLRFAASILTDDVKFKRTSSKDPSHGRLSGWLKWLTWLEMQTNNGSNVAVGGVAVANISPHDQIVTTINDALSDATTVAITFDWTRDASLSVNVSSTVSGGKTTYSISVKSLGAADSDVDNTPPDHDDDYDPDPDISTPEPEAR